MLQPFLRREQDPGLKQRKFVAWLLGAPGIATRSKDATRGCNMLSAQLFKYTRGTKYGCPVWHRCQNHSNQTMVFQCEQQSQALNGSCQMKPSELEVLTEGVRHITSRDPYEKQMTTSRRNDRYSLVHLFVSQNGTPWKTYTCTYCMHQLGSGARGR